MTGKGFDGGGVEGVLAAGVASADDFAGAFIVLVSLWQDSQL